MRSGSQLTRAIQLNIVFNCIAAWLMLAVFRTLIVSPETVGESFWSTFFSNIGASYKDFLFIVALGCFFSLLVLLARRQRWLLKALCALFLISIALCVLWGFANINLTKLLGEPFTYPWLLYADFLQNADAKAAMLDAVNTRDTLLMLGSVVGVLVVGSLLGWMTFRMAGRLPARMLAALSAAPIILLAFVVQREAAATQLAPEKTVNPVWHFAASLMRGTTPELFTMPSRRGAEDFKPSADKRASSADFIDKRGKRIENVLIFVMESTPWEYLQTYGGKYPITPNILKHAPSSFRFDNIYAHAPATNYSLFSLFTSLYPDISYYSMTASHPDLPLKTISGVFADRDYRTGFFWSADMRFQAFDRFLETKHFDVVKDFRSIVCDRPVFEISSAQDKNMDYAYDVCLGDTVANWIDADPKKPFFAIMMTAMTHYPYTTNTMLQHYVDDEKQNEYLNALRIGDETFGVVMDRLAASGKLDSTLVVLVGDHGEAFGQHDNWGHATALYEENVHVPLMFFNSQLFNGQSAEAVGGLIDVAPTVLDIVGIGKPVTWQGKSLFGENRSERAYFFSPWRGFLFGYREGDTKVIYNAAAGKLEKYNLGRDPREKTNIAGNAADATALIEPIASWVQFQRGFIAEAVAMGDPNHARCKLSSLSFEAAGTSHDGPPRIDVLVDGKMLANLDIPGIESKAWTGEAVVAELRQAQQLAKPLTVKLPDIAGAKVIELRFANDMWVDGPNGADRNVFVTNIAANGINLPVDRYRLVGGDVGVVSGNGVELYRNGSITIRSPLIDGCH